MISLIMTATTAPDLFSKLSLRLLAKEERLKKVRGLFEKHDLYLEVDRLTVAVRRLRRWVPDDPTEEDVKRLLVEEVIVPRRLQKEVWDWDIAATNYPPLWPDTR